MISMSRTFRMSLAIALAALFMLSPASAAPVKSLARNPVVEQSAQVL